MVHLSTIGPLAIRLGSSRLAARSARTAAPLLYLVVERGKEIPRRTLIDLFFADSPEPERAHGVRQLMYRLRKAGVPVDGDMATVTLPRDAATWDVERVESGDPFTDDELHALTSGYLSDFASKASGPFADWLDGHRSTVTTTLRRSLLAQLRDEKAKHHFAAVDRIARACLAIDPFNEEATLATAEALVMSGSKVQALSVLDRYIDEVGPRSRDLRFAPKLLRERISEYVAEPGHRGEPPLVGRDSEMATLRALLARFPGGSAEACVLWGSSGIGKSRLMNEACSIAALQGLAVVRCGLQPHDQQRPLAVLRNMAPRLLDLPGSIGCDPESLAFIRGLCGRGEMPARELPRTAQDSEIALARVLASATDLLDAVCEERPVLLCVEDAHWLDPASIELIVEAVAGNRALCLLMASQRPIQLPPGLVNAARFSSIEVPRLSKESSQALIDLLFEQSDRKRDAEFIERAVRLADGVPFYLQSLFVEYAITGDRMAIPSTLTASLVSKLDRLAEPTRSVFDAIVVLGKHSSLARLEAIVQLPRHSLLTSLRVLEDGGLIRLVSNTVSCAHDLFGMAARERMPSSVSRMLHRAAAEMLETDGEAGGAEPWDIGVHWHAAGESAKGLSYVRRSAEEAIRLGRPQEAIAILSRSPQELATADHRLVLEMKLAAFEAAGQGLHVLACTSELLALIGGGEATARRRLQLAHIEAGIQTGAASLDQEQKLREIMLTENDDKLLRRSIMLTLAVAEETMKPELAAECLPVVERLGQGTVPGLITYMAYHAMFGDMTTAEKSALELQRTTWAQPATRLRYAAEVDAGEVLFRTGRKEPAVDCLRRACSTATQLGLQSGQIGAAAILTLVHWCFGEDDKFEELYQQTEYDLRRLPTSSNVMEHYSNGVLRALSQGRPDEAQAMLDEVVGFAPLVSQGSRRHLTLAYELRIELARGTPPSRARTEELRTAFHRSKKYLGQDIIADTLVGALRGCGLSDEADDIKRDFVNKWRRDRYPIPTRLTNLLSP